MRMLSPFTLMLHVKQGNLPGKIGKCILSALLVSALAPVSVWADAGEMDERSGLEEASTGSGNATGIEDVSDDASAGATQGATSDDSASSVSPQSPAHQDATGVQNAEARTVCVTFPAVVTLRQGVLVVGDCDSDDVVSISVEDPLFTGQADLILRAEDKEQVQTVEWSRDEEGAWLACVAIADWENFAPGANIALDLRLSAADQTEQTVKLLPADDGVTISVGDAKDGQEITEATSLRFAVLTQAGSSADAEEAAPQESAAPSVSVSLPTEGYGIMDGVKYFQGEDSCGYSVPCVLTVTGENITRKTVTMNDQEMTNVLWEKTDGGWTATVYVDAQYQDTVITLTAENAEGSTSTATSGHFVLDKSNPCITFGYDPLTNAAVVTIREAYLDTDITTINGEVISADKWTISAGANGLKEYRTTVSLARDLSKHPVRVNAYDYALRNALVEYEYDQAQRDIWIADTTKPQVTITPQGTYLSTINGVDYYADLKNIKVSVEEENLDTVAIVSNVAGLTPQRYTPTVDKETTETTQDFYTGLKGFAAGCPVEYIVTAVDKEGWTTEYSYGASASDGRTVDQQGQVRTGKMFAQVDTAFPEMGDVTLSAVGDDSLTCTTRDGVDYFDGALRLSFSVDNAPVLDLEHSVLSLPNGTYTLSSIVDSSKYPALDEDDYKPSAYFALNLPIDGSYSATLTLTTVFGEAKTISYGDLVAAGKVKYQDQSLSGAAFVIDQTAPTISVTFDHNDAVHGRYYSQVRTAYVTVNEANFYSDLMSVQTTGTCSGWVKVSEGTYRATVVFSDGNDHTLQVSGADVVGHQATPYAADSFTVDTVQPVIEVTFDQTNSSGFYAAVRTATVVVRETNFDPTSMRVATTGQTGGWRDIGGGQHVMIVVFPEGQNHTLEVTGADLAGNVADDFMADTFTVDLTAPVIQVSFDNESAANGKYYKAQRVAAITVTDVNFDENLFQIDTTGSVGSWYTSGDQHIVEVTFGTDGTYDLAVSGQDQAGNAADPYTSDTFVIDLTVPTMDIQQIEDGSTYTAQVAPQLAFADEANFDSQSISWSLVGAKRGDVSSLVSFSEVSTSNGINVALDDFASTPLWDDIYTLTASVSDLAGNQVEKTITFYVDRFGSSYQVFASDGWEVTSDESGYLGFQWVKDSAQEKAPTITIRETNVVGIVSDTQTVTIMRDGAPVTKGSVQAHITEEDGWTVCDYVISAELFNNQEGEYKIYVTSTDNAGNTRSNAAFYDEQGNFCSAVACYEWHDLTQDKTTASTGASQKIDLTLFAGMALVVAVLAMAGIWRYFRRKDQAVRDLLSADEGQRKQG